MLLRFASVFVRRGKAYLPVTAQTEAGLLVSIEPVYTADLSPEDLVAALEKVLAAGHPRIPHPTREEFRHLRKTSPILQAARVKSWKEFSQHSAVYDIEWTEQAINMYIAQLDRLGRYASAKKLSFAKDTALRAIVEAILEDVSSRPELLAGSET